MGRKPDAAEIERVLDDLAGRMERQWPHNYRRHWPRYLFHITDVCNAASILSSGQLLSRTHAVAAGRLLTDTKSPEIIERTAVDVLASVRLYFRPRTPTFVHSEGIRPPHLRSQHGSHCPVPVAFLFDARAVLTTVGVVCSTGNASSGRASFGDDAPFIRAMPFDAIYHEGTMREGEREELRFRRCAEVLTPSPLPLEGNLMHVFVRSSAEQQTLRTLLDDSPAANGPFGFSIRINTNAPLFLRRWTYLNEVVPVADRLICRFSPDSETPGPFVARFELLDPTSGEPRFSETRREFRADATVSFPLPQSAPGVSLRARLFLDDCLAYDNMVTAPFDHAVISPMRGADALLPF